MDTHKLPNYAIEQYYGQSYKQKRKSMRVAKLGERQREKLFKVYISNYFLDCALAMAIFVLPYRKHREKQ